MEIDWGLTDKILNTVYKPDKQPQLSGLELPPIETLREMFFNNGPQIFLTLGKRLLTNQLFMVLFFHESLKGYLKTKK